MRKMLRAVTLAVPFVFAAGLASADEPMQLTDTQLDVVTAGATAIAQAQALALGPNTAVAATATLTQAVRTDGTILSQLSRAVPTAVTAVAQSTAAAN